RGRKVRRVLHFRYAIHGIRNRSVDRGADAGDRGVTRSTSGSDARAPDHPLEQSQSVAGAASGRRIVGVAMYRQDALEAAPLVQRALVCLNKIIPPSGRPGSDARTAIGDLYVNVYALLIGDELGAPLDNVFDLVQQAGATYFAFGAVRDRIELEAPTTLGGNLAKNLCIDWCLTMQGVCISGMTFTSRSQVDQVIAALQQPFYNAEEIAADSMDQMTFQNLIAFARVDHKS